MNIKVKSNFVKRVSMFMTLSFVALNLGFKPLDVMAASATNTPYTIDSSNYDKPQPHAEQSILADIYKDTPGYQPTDSKIPKGWQFYETELFPISFVNGGDKNYIQRYNGSPTAENYMNNAHYSYDTSQNVGASNYYDNWRFPNLKNVDYQYTYGNLIYYQPMTILNDNCNIEYQVDTNTFDAGANNGTTAYNKMPTYTSLNAGDEYVADYHISGVTANPVAIAPTADFYFNSGSTSATVQAGDTLKVIDGTTDSKYDNTSTKYWSTYYDGSGTINKHNNGATLSQSYTYNNAVITGSSWSIYDSNGNNVTSQFTTQLLNRADSMPSKPASAVSITVNSSIAPGTYYIGHSVTDNWNSKSQEQRRSFTVSQPPTQQYNLTVHYIDQTGNEIASTEVDNASNPYTPTAPANYSLTGNYRTSATGSDSPFNYNNGTEINVDLSSSDQSIYVVCSKDSITPQPTPTPTTNEYNLNVTYVDEDTNQPIPNYVDNKTYSDSELKHNNGTEFTFYMPTLTPIGYTVDTSKYFDASKGYLVEFDCPESMANTNGHSDNKTANLQVYCKSNGGNINPTPTPQPQNHELFVYYIDTNGNPINNSNESDTQIIDTPMVSYTPTAPDGYTLTGNYRTTVKGIDIPYNGSISVDLSNNDQTIYVVCSEKNTPPTVTLNLPPTVALGDDLPVNAVGNDSDGDTLTYSWNAPSGMTGDLSGIGGTVQFDNPSDVGQEKTFTVTVDDGKGGTATATATTKVVEPQPTISINQSGCLKENRKVTLSETSYSGSKSYSIDNSKTKWAFYDRNNNLINVTNTADSGIVESLDSTTGTSNMNVLFTKAGTYTVKCTVYNNYGTTATDTKQITIVADVAPVTDFDLLEKEPLYTDIEHLDRVTWHLNDKSYSSDGDSISKRVWVYAFDSNNNGTPNDDQWYVYNLNYSDQFGDHWQPITDNSGNIVKGSQALKFLEDSSYLDKINSGNLTSISITPKNFYGYPHVWETHVGWYYFNELVVESYGQDTIQSLITSKDLKFDAGWEDGKSQKGQRDNTPPTVVFG